MIRGFKDAYGVKILLTNLNHVDQIHEMLQPFDSLEYVYLSYEGDKFLSLTGVRLPATIRELHIDIPVSFVYLLPNVEKLVMWRNVGQLPSDFFTQMPRLQHIIFHDQKEGILLPEHFSNNLQLKSVEREGFYPIFHPLLFKRKIGMEKVVIDGQVFRPNDTV